MKTILIPAALLLGAITCQAVDFDRTFDDRTLKLDYLLAGTDSTSAIFFDEAASWDGWAGRRHNLERPFLADGGGITVRDHATGDTIYANTFSTLFQEWQSTPEAHGLARSYEMTFLVPYPKEKADVTVYLNDNRCRRVAEMTHTVDPTDILIRKLPTTAFEQRVIRHSGDHANVVDLVIVGEGYTADDVDKFFADAVRADQALFSHEPFASMVDRFNVVAVATLSTDRGPSVPHDNVWNNTIFETHYDTFYFERYLTTNAIHKIHEAVAGVHYEHIIMLVNTPIYGGGGFFNTLTVAASDNAMFKPVLVHEFGHAYGGLADEYFNYNEQEDQYPLDIEPWEPNITTLTNFDRKWADLVPKGTPIPTPEIEMPELYTLDLSDPAVIQQLIDLTHNVGVFEGGGYRCTGVYRPTQECRMRSNVVEYFCPVCARAIIQITDFYTK